MISIILIRITIGFASLLFWVGHPISLGAVIFLLRGLCCLIIGREVSSWYGYIIFLIYVGGILVIFAYIVALAPNPHFKLDLVYLSCFRLIRLSIRGYQIYYPSIGSEERLVLNIGSVALNEVHIISISRDICFVLIGLGALLLLVLFLVCIICRKFKGPLRLLRKKE